jgi:hypothetical protein
MPTMSARVPEKHFQNISLTPATAPVMLSFMGVFGKRLFERSELPIDAHEAEQRRKQAVGGVVYFGYFLLDKQNKVTRIEVK